ncbi:hypothetical protein RN001_002230 [Aquatica leii]|uniref:Uncharacterized protein n=1 Tax=Aquatica leii TaxID=1421715 RepID=A0AAN7SLQ9_9COLE|nr:hypothetical protein RN001_002230 [Aquatica leii]
MAFELGFTFTTLEHRILIPQIQLDEMALVSDLLKELKPITWTDECYTGQSYVKVPLIEGSEEYKEILVDFKSRYSLQVVSISRIQHPFAFCRFKLRQWEIFRKKGTLPQEKRHYIRLGDDGNLDKLLRNNCDSRCDALSYFNNNSKFVIVAKTFMDRRFDERDSHRFPEYLIECLIESGEQNLTPLENLLSRLNL